LLLGNKLTGGLLDREFRLETHLSTRGYLTSEYAMWGSCPGGKPIERLPSGAKRINTE
jgi:hypothetical protein